MYVLVFSVLHSFIDQCDQVFAHRVVRESLSQVDRFVGGGEGGHEGEDGGSYGGKFSLNVG